jgi:hypothetical protein
MLFLTRPDSYLGINSIASPQHGPDGKIGYRTAGFAQHAFGAGPAQSVKKSVRPVRRHHDQVGTKFLKSQKDEKRIRF